MAESCNDPCDPSQLESRKTGHVLLGNKYFLDVTGKTLNSHQQFIGQVKNKVSWQEVKTVDGCDFILVFCPIVSRAGTDIQAALEKLHNYSADKPAVLVVLHHTFDPECVVSESSTAVNKNNIITVDCLFHEDQGLLRCKKNSDAICRIVMHTKPKIQMRRSFIRGRSTEQSSTQSIGPFGQSNSQPAEHNYAVSRINQNTEELKNTEKEINEKETKGPVNEGRSTEQSSTQSPSTFGQSNSQPVEYNYAVSCINQKIEALKNIAKEINEKETKGPVNEEIIITTELRLVLLGMIGSHRTAVKNIVLGREAGNQANTSPTTANQWSVSTQVSGRKMTVMDIPDWPCSGTILEELSQTVGPQVFLLVIPVKSEGSEDYILKMENVFGEGCWRKTMIIFTVTDELQMSIDEFIQSGEQKIQRLVEKCENRFHCLYMKESGDGSQVSELLEKIEKMVEGNRNGTETYKIITDMDKERHINNERIKAVKERMTIFLKNCDTYVKDYENDLKNLETKNIENKIIIGELKKEYELKREIGETLLKKYDEVTRLDENRLFIKVTLPENQQTIWLSLPREQIKNPKMHNEAQQLEELFKIMERK